MDCVTPAMSSLLTDCDSWSRANEWLLFGGELLDPLLDLPLGIDADVMSSSVADWSCVSTDSLVSDDDCVLSGSSSTTSSGCSVDNIMDCKYPSIINQITRQQETSTNESYILPAECETFENVGVLTSLTVQSAASSLLDGVSSDESVVEIEVGDYCDLLSSEEITSKIIRTDPNPLLDTCSGEVEVEISDQLSSEDEILNANYFCVAAGGINMTDGAVVCNTVDCGPETMVEDDEIEIIDSSSVADVESENVEHVSTISADILEYLFANDFCESQSESSLVFDGNVSETSSINCDDAQFSFRCADPRWVQRRLRKMQQNKTAASRYREKKRSERGLAQSEISYLEQRNAELKAKLDEMLRQLRYLKSVVDELD